MNKGTTKIKAISRRALEIREKAGFTTETIVKKRYKMAYVPDAIKQAAKELKTPGKAKRTKRVVNTGYFKIKGSKSSIVTQYKDLKAKSKADILLFDTGDVYTAIKLDAITVSKILNVNLLPAGEYKYISFPKSKLEENLKKLVFSGLKVGIVDNLPIVGQKIKTSKEIVQKIAKPEAPKRTKRVLNTRAITKKAGLTFDKGEKDKQQLIAQAELQRELMLDELSKSNNAAYRIHKANFDKLNSSLKLVYGIDLRQPKSEVIKTKWWQFVHYNSLKEVSDRLKQMSRSELVELKKHKYEVAYNRKMVSSRDKEDARESIRIINIVLGGYEALDNYNLERSKKAEAPKRTKRVLNTRAITKKATPAPVGAPLVMKRERVRVVKRFVRIKPSGKDFKSIYGVSALKVYEAMQLEKYKSLSITSIFEILTGKRDFEPTPQFWGKFIDELAKSGKYLSGNKRISIEWELKGYGLTPVDKMPAKGKSGMYGLTSMVSSDTLRPAMHGVFVEDGYLIATDAHALVIIKDTENLTKKWDGQIIGIRKKDFNQKINEVYPKWRNVMPDRSRSVISAKIDIEDILPKVYGQLQILKSVVDAHFIILNIKGNKIGVSPEKLINLLSALRANGSKKAIFHYYDPARAILIETENENKGIVMPMLVNDLSTSNDFVVTPININ